MDNTAIEIFDKHMIGVGVALQKAWDQGKINDFIAMQGTLLNKAILVQVLAGGSREDFMKVANMLYDLADEQVRFYEQ